jgi:hypothetical protein
MTWTARILLFVLILTLIASTRNIWSPPLAWYLVCSSSEQEADVIVVENLSYDFLLFEKAADLMNRGVAHSALVLVQASGHNPNEPGPVPRGIAEVMITAARLRNAELLPIEQREPITLNAARQVAAHLKSRLNLNSALIVTSGFRSKRTQAAFSSVLGEVGIAVSCMPVWKGSHPDNWTTTWHGIQEVCHQYLKLFYYKFAVLNKWF